MLLGTQKAAGLYGKSGKFRIKKARVLIGFGLWPHAVHFLSLGLSSIVCRIMELQ